jgi:hypothetical protein
MGHEYVELKNTTAAVQCYRQVPLTLTHQLNSVSSPCRLWKSIEATIAHGMGLVKLMRCCTYTCIPFTITNELLPYAQSMLGCGVLSVSDSRQMSPSSDRSSLPSLVGNCLSRLTSGGVTNGSVSAIQAREMGMKAKREAIEAYKRAVACDESEGLATRELARLYRSVQSPALLAHFPHSESLETTTRLQNIMVAM